MGSCLFLHCGHTWFSFEEPGVSWPISERGMRNWELVFCLPAGKYPRWRERRGTFSMGLCGLRTAHWLQHDFFVGNALPVLSSCGLRRILRVQDFRSIGASCMGRRLLYNRYGYPI